MQQLIECLPGVQQGLNFTVSNNGMAFYKRNQYAMVFMKKEKLL